MKRITGLPLVFNSASVDLGGFTEVIDPAAVDRTLRDGSDVLLLKNHDSNYPLARRSARSLQLQKDHVGLAVDAYVDDSISFAADTVKLIEQGTAAGGSFAFRTLDDDWSLRNGEPFRRLLDIVITEVSCAVTFPAYPATRLYAVERSVRHQPERGEQWYRSRLRLAR